MAFLDNSGDIILDAVLTDYGRQLMARGNFKIVKFAFSDEEINYELFNASAETGQEDLQIMQTPILEALTNNTTLMKTKLLSVNRNNILYMPIFKLNTNLEDAKQHSLGNYVIIADTNTEPTNAPLSLVDGVLHGVNNSALRSNRHHIAIDQGLETAGNPPRTSPMAADLMESGYLIRMDHRILRLTGFNGQGYSTIPNSFVDDDSIASYYVSTGDGSVTGTSSRISNLLSDNVNTRQIAEQEEVFNGPLGPRLKISAITTQSIQQSDNLFDELGTSGTTTLSLTSDSGDDLTSGNYKFIDTLINVVGITSGYSMDIPVRIVKKTS